MGIVEKNQVVEPYSTRHKCSADKSTEFLAWRLVWEYTFIIAVDFGKIKGGKAMVMRRQSRTGDNSLLNPGVFVIGFLISPILAGF